MALRRAIAHGLKPRADRGGARTRLPDRARSNARQTLNFRRAVRIGDVGAVTGEVVELMPKARSAGLPARRRRRRVMLDGKAQVGAGALGLDCPDRSARRSAMPRCIDAQEFVRDGAKLSAPMIDRPPARPSFTVVRAESRRRHGALRPARRRRGGDRQFRRRAPRPPRRHRRRAGARPRARATARRRSPSSRIRARSSGRTSRCFA